MPRLRDPRSGVVVQVSDGTASRLRWPPADDDQPDDDTTCPDCGFVAKSPAGLGSHRRTHD